MEWTVRVVGGERGDTTLASHSFPSRAKAAASLRSYGAATVVRDQERCLYTVRPLKSSTK